MTTPRHPPRLRPGATIPVESAKFDGSMHYRYTMAVVADDVFTPAVLGTVKRMTERIAEVAAG